MIIWKGWGLIVIPIFFLAPFITGWLLRFFPFHLGSNFSMSLGYVLAAVACWFIGKKLNYIHGQAKYAFKDQHSLFFIPVQHWGILFGALSILMMFGFLWR